MPVAKTLRQRYERAGGSTVPYIHAFIVSTNRIVAIAALTGACFCSGYAGFSSARAHNRSLQLAGCAIILAAAAGFLLWLAGP